MEISIEEIVVGDVVTVSSGEQIPADAFIISGNLKVDQSMITGEGKEIEKICGCTIKDLIAQKDAEIVAFIDNAIAENKITEDAKEKWVEMANTNFEMVQATLNSIAPSAKISKEIANDPANVENAEQGLTDAEKLMKAAVEAAVGKDFEFKTLQD